VQIHPKARERRGTFAAALQVAAKAPDGSVLLAMLPDTGERYLSTPLFEGVETGSDPCKHFPRSLPRFVPRSPAMLSSSTGG